MDKTSGSGLGMEAEGEGSEVDALFAEPEPPPQPEVETPAAEVVEAPAEPPVEAQPEAPEAEVETEAEPAPPVAEQEAPAEQPSDSAPDGGKWLDRFESYEAAKAAYKDAQGWATRESQRRVEAERKAQALEQGLEQIKPLLPQFQQWLAEQQGIDPQDVSPQDVQALARQEAEKIVTERDKQRTAQEVTSAIQSFRGAHPEIVGTPLEGDVVRLFGEYREVDPEFIPNRDNMETIYKVAQDPRVKGVLDTLQLFPDPEFVERAEELVSNPALAKAIYANPHLIESDAGMEWARGLVTTPPEQVTAPAQQASAQQREEDKKRVFVEPATSGAPAQAAPGERPNDPWAEVERIAEEDKRARSGIGID